MMRRACLLFFITTLVQFATAQVSPSTIGIIDPDNPRASQSEPNDMSSGRYKVRPKTQKKEKTLTEEYESTKIPPKKEEDAAKAVPPAKVEMPAPENSTTLLIQTPITPVHETEKPEDLQEYRSFLPPDDPRRNLIELRAAPIFLYNDSSSPYWFRNYTNFSPGFTATGDIWFTPLFGFEANYRKSIASSLKNSPTSDTYVPASHEWITAGLRFRRFFGYGENVPMLVIGTDYREYNLKVPSDDPNRARLKTTSPRLILETMVPSSLRFSWLLNMEITPWSRHQEMGTGFNLQSGTENETFGYGVGIGGEYKLARTSRMYFKLSYFLERSAFSGTANRADLVTGITPSNVPVNNSFTIFEFGYVWGQ